MKRIEKQETMAGSSSEYIFIVAESLRNVFKSKLMFHNGRYARKKNMAPAGNECYNAFLFDGFYI